jgi:hypothetical protein
MQKKYINDRRDHRMEAPEYHNNIEDMFPNILKK